MTHIDGNIANMFDYWAVAHLIQLKTPCSREAMEF